MHMHIYNDFGNGIRSNIVADHIHLLMLRGLNENWKPCIGYYVGTVNSSVLPELIKKAGFHLKALSSDQGSINR